MTDRTPIRDMELPVEMAGLFADLIVLYENVETAQDPDPIAAWCHEEGWGYLEYLPLALAHRGYTLQAPSDSPAQEIAPEDGSREER